MGGETNFDPLRSTQIRTDRSELEDRDASRSPVVHEVNEGPLEKFGCGIKNWVFDNRRMILKVTAVAFTGILCAGALFALNAVSAGLLTLLVVGVAGTLATRVALTSMRKCSPQEENEAKIQIDPNQGILEKGANIVKNLIWQNRRTLLKTGAVAFTALLFLGAAFTLSSVSVPLMAVLLIGTAGTGASRVALTAMSACDPHPEQRVQSA
ncbi:MAG: hypothetical protein K2P51_04305 [Rhabdochlamydiaceae bacterium]|nr:hypothetical protein [Rhabdochlamydiaceae bacterium]